MDVFPFGSHSIFHENPLMTLRQERTLREPLLKDFPPRRPSGWNDTSV